MRIAVASLGLALIAGCGLPRDAALADWARSASVVVDQPRLAPPPEGGVRAMQEALAVYLFALGVLAEEGRLTFHEAAYEPLASRTAAVDPAAAAAIGQLGALLLRDSLSNPPSPSASDGTASDGGAVVPEDTRLRATLRGADAPVQTLIAALSAAVARGEPAASPDGFLALHMAAEPVLRQRELLDARAAAARAAARSGYLDVLAQIGEGHTLLHARARHVTQRETSGLIRLAEERLLRAAARLPRNGAPDVVAAVLRP